MTLTPLVYWAQRHEEIFLRVELTDAQGHGAKGQHLYDFTLEFLLPVKAQASEVLLPCPCSCSCPCLLTDFRQVNISVKKEQWGWWERLTKQERKPLFLAPDFDCWLDESDAEMEIKVSNERKASRHDEEGSISLKTGFLFTYNLVQFLGFSWIFVNMTIRLLKFDSFYDTFHTISSVMFFCQILAVVEVLNAAFGLVRTSVTPNLIQLFGRNFVLFVIFGCLEEMQNKPVVFFVFYLWSAIEIFRYPFYMLGCFNTEWKILTWLRYSLWMPLYPLGALAEAVAVAQSIPIFDKTNLFSIPLPRALGTSLSFSNVLRVHLVLMFLGLFLNFRHLYKQRQRRFRATKRKAH
uniref:Very-long-chain (3R)-3-hydroxyacyl-CoA dehydratase n=1 Tax=Hippocampus comes TaxID=109280 RepID=A0A3Q3DGA3_HIPCM